MPDDECQRANVLQLAIHFGKNRRWAWRFATRQWLPVPPEERLSSRSPLTGALFGQKPLGHSDFDIPSSVVRPSSFYHLPGWGRFPKARPAPSGCNNYTRIHSYPLRGAAARGAPGFAVNGLAKTAWGRSFPTAANREALWHDICKDRGRPSTTGTPDPQGLGGPRTAGATLHCPSGPGDGEPGRNVVHWPAVNLRRRV